MTPEELEKQHEIALNKVIEVAGGDTSYLARMLGVSIPVVNGWSKRKRISKNGAILVGLNLAFRNKVTVKELRPDLTDGKILEMTKKVLKENPHLSSEQ